MNKLITSILMLLCVDAQAQTWTFVAKEGNATTSPVVTIKAGQTYRFGSGTKWCASVTPTVDTKVTVWWSAMGCDPAPGIQKELDVLVPAVPVVVPPIPLKTWSCTGTITYSLMSDGTFSVTNTGALSCPETL